MADFARQAEKLSDAAIEVIAVSADPEDKAREIRSELGFDALLGHDVDPRTFADATGCFFDADDGYLHACGFILRPDATVASAVYSSGALGRLWPDQVVEQVEFFRKDSGDG